MRDKFAYFQLFLFCRFKTSSIPTSVSKGAPDFCTVYVISKGKLSSVRSASRPAPYISPLLDHIEKTNTKQVQHSEAPPRLSMNSRGLFLSLKFSTYFDLSTDANIHSVYVQIGPRSSLIT